MYYTCLFVLFFATMAGCGERLESTMQSSTVELWLGHKLEPNDLPGWRQASTDRILMCCRDIPCTARIHITDEVVVINSKMTTVWMTQGRLREIQVLPLDAPQSLLKTKEMVASIAEMLDSHKICEITPVLTAKLASLTESDFDTACVDRRDGIEVRIELKRREADGWIILIELGVLELYQQ